MKKYEQYTSKHEYLVDLSIFNKINVDSILDDFIDYAFECSDEVKGLKGRKDWGAERLNEYRLILLERVNKLKEAKLQEIEKKIRSYIPCEAEKQISTEDIQDFIMNRSRWWPKYPLSVLETVIV